MWVCVLWILYRRVTLVIETIWKLILSKVKRISLQLSSPTHFQLLNCGKEYKENSRKYFSFISIKDLFMLFLGSSKGELIYRFFHQKFFEFFPISSQYYWRGILTRFEEGCPLLLLLRIYSSRFPLSLSLALGQI